jgi:hypothetical protein
MRPAGTGAHRLQVRDQLREKVRPIVQRDAAG